MKEFDSYLHKELSNLPFGLFEIISNFIELNPDIKVAFVGGYLRDLLIKKIHQNSFVRSIDIDIIIEGSALSLANFIKKNISNVDLCLIKEFELYNTVEMNINNIKVDIASAREEIYFGPGLNPSVSDSSIYKDLQRRDFTINTIAYEVSRQEVYDLYNGIEHIYKKELHLLHQNSISDDPSRILRCAKYASRLGFKISESSLNQSRKAIRQWPWDIKRKISYPKFPPGISIRIRMELTEIFKNENLGRVIKELIEWDLISILDKSIKVDSKFLRGLKRVKQLDGKFILYLLKDSLSLDKSCERFYLNKKEKAILDNYLDIKKSLKLYENKFLNFSPSKWTRYIEDNNFDVETVKLIISDGGIFWKPFFRWFFIYRFVKSSKNGEELKKEGWDQGKGLGNEIKRLRYLAIDNFSKS